MWQPFKMSLVLCDVNDAHYIETCCCITMLEQLGLTEIED